MAPIDLYVEADGLAPRQVPVADLERLASSLTALDTRESVEAALNLRDYLAVADEVGLSWNIRPEWVDAVLKAAEGGTIQTRQANSSSSSCGLSATPLGKPTPAPDLELSAAITIDVEALTRAIADQLQLEAEGSPWMTVAEAADYLRVSKRKVEEWVAGRRIPFSRLEGRIVLNRRELDRWALAAREGQEAVTSPCRPRP